MASDDGVSDMVFPSLCILPELAGDNKWFSAKVNK
jgi:hypothetical protein